jgi:hypothetical protein
MQFNQEALKPAANITVDCGLFGAEQQPYIQVDSFVSDPGSLREYCIRNAAFEVADNFYPGVRMAVPLIYTAALAKTFSSYIQQLFQFNPRNVKKAVSAYSIVNFKPEQLSLMQRIPHFDAPSKHSFAAVHYLFEDDTSGTALYRHRNTGYEFVDSERYEGYLERIKEEFPSPAHYPQGYIQGDTDQFEQIGAFPSKYNRLVMYRGSSLHSGMIGPDYNFDSSPETGRLTITTFVEFNEP